MEYQIKYNANEWLEIYTFMISFVKYKSIKLVRMTQQETDISNKYGLKSLYNNVGLTEDGLNILISLHFLFTALIDDIQFGNKDFNYIVTIGQDNIMYCIWNKIEAEIKNGIVPEPYYFYENKEIEIIKRIR